MSIDWLKLRPWHGSQQLAFQKLSVLLFAHEDVPNGVFVSKGNPDAGIEAYWIFGDRKEWGLQAKFFLTALGDVQWAQIDDSVRTALDSHPHLCRYTICIPQDRADPRLDKQRWFMDKWNEHVRKWSDYATSRGLQVTFDYWGETELLQRLTRPEHRGRLLFWFDKQLITMDWLKARVEETIENVGPRYTPEIHVELPISRVFDGLGHSPSFFNQISQFRRTLRKYLRKVSSARVRDVPTLSKPWATLEVATDNALKSLESLGPSSLNRALLDRTGTFVDESGKANWECIRALEEYEAARAKQKDLDPASLHSYAEHDLRNLVDELYEIRDFCTSETAASAALGAVLLRGAAGTGKTHLLCDVARKRIDEGFPTLLVLGTQFEDAEPLSQISSGITGLQVSRDDFLAAADAAGEAAGGKFILLVDAINEGTGRALWPKYLSGMLVVLRNYSHIGIALSVRDSYEDLVVPSQIGGDRLTRITHHGFEGHEYDATHTFFAHYKLKPPSIPLLNPEFSNPQFLKLFCRTLTNLGQTDVPRGLSGLKTVFDQFLGSVNDKLSRPEWLDVDKKDRLIQRAARLLVEQMAVSKHQWLDRSAAKQIVNELLPGRPDSLSLFRHLLSEEVIYEDRTYSVESGQFIDVIRFSFERFADHLIAEYLLSSYDSASELGAAFDPNGDLHGLIKDEAAARSARGLIEAMSIQVPERYKSELIRIVPAVGALQPGIIGFIDSILWRNVTSFTDETTTVLNELLDRWRIEDHLFERLLLVAATPGHPWNAEFLHRNLLGRPMPRRDSTWSIFVFRQYGRRGSVDRLIEWAWSESNKSHLDDRSIELAAVALAWFLTTSHRFARDRATKALVALLSERLSILSQVLRRFVSIDDLYVLERLMAVGYGCAMRTRSNDQLKELATTVFEITFLNPGLKPHILLRNYARGVVEVAVDRGIKLGFDVRQARSPYESTWEEPVFAEGELEKWSQWSSGMPDTEWARVHLHESVMGSEDFARYIIGTNSGHFSWSAQRQKGSARKRRRYSSRSREDAFDLRLAQRWIFRRVIDFGWRPEFFGSFDREVSRGIGREEHKPERIGKKYQWLAFHEFLARVSDNFVLRSEWGAQKRETYEGPWQIGFIADIDPSCVIRRTLQDSDKSCWWQPSTYAAWAGEEREWLTRTEDLPDPRTSIAVSDTNGNDWYVLETHFSFTQPGNEEEEQSDESPQRQIWFQIRSYLVARRDSAKFLKWASEQDFMGRWMPESHAAHDLFLGEYYWSPAYRFFQQPYYQREIWSRGAFQKRLPVRVAPSTDAYYFERGYDCSIDETIHISLPSELIVRGLNLQWNHHGGEYVDVVGRLVAYDPCVLEAGPTASVIRRSDLMAFLKSKNLGIVWTVLGEKNVLDRRPDHWPGRLEMSGAFGLIDGDLRGKVNKKFLGSQGSKTS